MDWAGGDVLPPGYGCACNGACASCAVSRDYGIAPAIVAAIISGAALVATTGIGVAATAAQAKREREAAQKEAAAARKQEFDVLAYQARQAEAADKRAQEVASQQAIATTEQQRIIEESSAATVKTIMIGAAALALIYFTMKDD